MFLTMAGKILFPHVLDTRHKKIVGQTGWMKDENARFPAPTGETLQKCMCTEIRIFIITHTEVSLFLLSEKHAAIIRNRGAIATFF